MQKLQTMLSEDCFRESYQKRLIKSDNKEKDNKGVDHYVETNIKINAVNIMNIGVYLSIVAGTLVAAGFSYFYGHKHPHFSSAAFMFTLSSILYSYALRLNVGPQLDFNFRIMVICEGVSFTVNTLAQAVMIRVLSIDPILSFGAAKLLSSFVLVVAYLLLTMKRPEYTSSLALSRLCGSHSGGFLLPNTIKFSMSVAYNSLLNEFFDQTYFVVFASDADYLGELNLIKGFGSLFVRFIYTPINNVTYNLYAKIHTESSIRAPPGRRQELARKMTGIVSVVLFAYTTLSCFFFFYGWFTAQCFLSLVFGQVWVGPVGFESPADFRQGVSPVHPRHSRHGGGEQPGGVREERF